MLRIEESLKVDKNGNPYPYQDSLGKWTIGIGKLCGDGSSSDPCPKNDI